MLHMIDFKKIFPEVSHFNGLIKSFGMFACVLND